MYRKFEELQVYRLAEELADRIWNLCIEWDYFPRTTVGKQLVRAADSIPANLSEGHGRFSFKENAQFCYFARGSLSETRNWLRRAQRRWLIGTDEVRDIERMMNELGPKLNAYINSIKRHVGIDRLPPSTKY